MVSLPEKKDHSEGLHHLSHFESFRRAAAHNDPAWLIPLREKAMHRFEEIGFPTFRDEAWRYTDVRPASRISFHPDCCKELRPVTSDMCAPFITDAANAPYVLTFVDGAFQKDLSRVSALPKNVLVGSLSTALKEHSALLEARIGRYVSFEHDAFAALNTAFMHDGAFLYVPKKVELAEPIQLLFLFTRARPGLAMAIRNLIVLESGARATVTETYASLDKEEYLANVVTEMAVEDEAELTHYRIEHESPKGFELASAHARLGSKSRYRSVAVSLGARTSRYSLDVSLEGEGAECSLDGLYMTRGEEHVDHVTFIRHKVPHGTSRQLYKGILDGRSTTVFSGKVLVVEDAQKTDAEQTNKNLLLSNQATANTKPQLEIFADDVKCTHGAAIGQVDEEALFYLKARGIGEKEARSILTHGFASEVIDRIGLDTLRRETNRLVHERLEAV